MSSSYFFITSFLGLIWLVLAIVIIIQVFKRIDLEINTKLLWTFLILFIPYVGLFIYLLVTYKKIPKWLLYALIAAIIGGIAVWYFIFYKPTHYKRDVADEVAINITAKQIVKNYQANEDSANKIYLNKAISITGEVLEAKKNQDGKPTVTLKSDDSFSNIYCTLKDDAGQIQGGSTITVKGICTGFLSDVVIIDAIIIKK